MSRAEGKPVRQGDEVVLVDVGPVRQKPQRNSRSWPPAIVAHIVIEPRTDVVVAMLVWLQSADQIEKRTFAEVSDAVQSVGGRIDWDAPFPAASAEARAIRALWSA